MKRRRFLKLSSLLGLSGITAGRAISEAPPQAKNKLDAVLSATPSETKGPFYPLVAQADTDFDLTQIKNHNGKASGTHVFIEGAVVATNGEKIQGATVDVWQANSHGRYNHPHDSSRAPLDPNFQGWAIVDTGQSGEFRFKTVIPGAYKASRSWERPPHIHFKVGKRGHEELVTQMYFPDQKLNKSDHLLRSKSSAEQAQMIARKDDHQRDGLDVYRYTIVLKKL